MQEHDLSPQVTHDPGREGQENNMFYVVINVIIKHSKLNWST